MLKAIISTRSKIGTRSHGVAAWLGLAMLVLVLGATDPARAEVLLTVRQLLAEQFKASARVTYVRVRPTPAQRARVEQRLGHGLARSEYTVYIATSVGHVDGYALFDEERGQHELISLGTFFDAQGRVTRVEVLAYREPYGDGIRAERFRRQFVGRNASSGFAAEHDIDAVSGASISSRSMCVGVQRAAILLDEIVLKDRTVLATL
jgi:Na+-translocating ferredoxin:NAD+ oxidoreductase RnfG subunit